MPDEDDVSDVALLEDSAAAEEDVVGALEEDCTAEEDVLGALEDDCTAEDDVVGALDEDVASALEESAAEEDPGCAEELLLPWLAEVLVPAELESVFPEEDEATPPSGSWSVQRWLPLQ